MRAPSDVVDVFQPPEPEHKGEQGNAPWRVDRGTELSQRHWRSDIRLFVLVAAAIAAWGLVFLALRGLIGT